MSSLKLCSTLMLVLALAAISGCSKNNPTNTGEGSNVVSPTFTLNDNTNYQVTSISIGQSGTTDSYVYGIVKFKYLGSGSVDYVGISASFKDGQGNVLFTDDSYIRNLSDCFDGYAYNTNTFLTAVHDTGYYYIIEDMGTRKAADIAKVELTITSEDFVYAPPMGMLANSGSPYATTGNVWCQNVTNSGNIIVSNAYTRFVFKDSQNKLFMWTFPESYVSNSIEDTYQVGQSGYFKSYDMTPDYMTTSLDIQDVCLDWDTSSTASTKVSLLRISSPDQNNLLLRQSLDKITRENMLRSGKK